MERRSLDDKSRAIRRLGAASIHLDLGHETIMEQGTGRGHKQTSRDFPVRQDAIGTTSLLWGRREEKLMTSSVKPPLLTRSRQSSTQQATEDEMVTGIAVSRDHLIFAESPLTPGVPIIYRPPEERIANPDRLNLDRKHLNICPILEGEEQLRLLNLQHNAISRIQHLGHLNRLVFLDLYNNMLQEITGLDLLGSLRVLMLGRNRIRRISGLEKLYKLDVLDLHGNLIQEVEHLEHLSHLRVLNLAGNEITVVSQLTGLTSLTELNLRRNRITHVYDADSLPSLQRLFLSHNLIQSISDIACLSRCAILTELTLDGNPLANHQEHRMTVLSQMTRLLSLNQKSVTDEEHEEAGRAAKEEEDKLKQLKEKERLMEEREETISAIQCAWEVEHSLRSDPVTDVSLNDVPGYTEEDGNSVQLYGSSAMESLTSGLFPTATHLVLHYMDFQQIQPYFQQVKDACSKITSLELHYINLSSLVELRQLANSLPHLSSFTISEDGNPITTHPLFHSLLLSLLPLTTINGVEPTAADQSRAQRLFGPVLSLTSSHQRSTGTTRPLSTSQSMSVSPVPSDWCSRLAEEAVTAHKRKSEFDALWPAMLNELVDETLIELQTTR